MSKSQPRPSELDERGLGPKPTSPKVDIYISGDVETDGPIPGPYSMLSFALVVAGTFDGKVFRRAGPSASTFYRELKPISDSFQPEALAVNGLDRERLVREGAPPENAMNEASAWVVSVAGSRRPVLVAYPAAFDWTWLYWYFTRFAREGSPFGFSSCYDIKTMIAVKRGSVMSESTKGLLPDEVRTSRTHTHNALDDAREQAEIFANLF